MMTIVIILIAYWFDYKSNKKQFISDLRGGSLFLLFLLLTFSLLYFVLNLAILYAVLAIGIVIPVSLLVRHLAKK
ncbi:hypothetical protein [uncultured Aquimarina sp.]|uniref:hypothetical protein n=1 Tax=uncultured Aquimarina sp. TaxID=575652 RepID=UPI0026281435|nr:hypothetical protein [uncultured Aquimarina sp.]